MRHYRLVDFFSYIVAIGTFLFSFFLFTNDTAEPTGSLFAALMAAGLAWVSYVLLRWVYLAFKQP